MLNIASVNMPKIKPETKTLKSKSPAEVADIFNVSKRQVERICKCYCDACFIKNCMSDSCSQWSPRSYCCPKTSAKQETAKKPCCVCQGPQLDGRLDSRKDQEELGGAFPCHPRRLHRQALRLSAKLDGNCSAGQRNPYKI